MLPVVQIGLEETQKFYLTIELFFFSVCNSLYKMFVIRNSLFFWVRQKAHLHYTIDRSDVSD